MLFVHLVVPAEADAAAAPVATAQTAGEHTTR
jgi:hypothetical protein